MQSAAVCRNDAFSIPPRDHKLSAARPTASPVQRLMRGSADVTGYCAVCDHRGFSKGFPADCAERHVGMYHTAAFRAARRDPEGLIRILNGLPAFRTEPVPVAKLKSARRAFIIGRKLYKAVFVFDVFHAALRAESRGWSQQPPASHAMRRPHALGRLKLFTAGSAKLRTLEKLLAAFGAHPLSRNGDRLVTYVRLLRGKAFVAFPAFPAKARAFPVLFSAVSAIQSDRPLRIKI